jgi:hypothetical protein
VKVITLRNSRKKERKEMTTSTAVAIIPSIDTLESEGLALAKMYKNEQASLKKRFKISISKDGLDYRLGKLMRSLRDEVGENGKINGNRLKEVGIANIDRRRRSEAEWFYNNQDDCLKAIKASKKGFTSLTALQLAMKKADKSNVGPNTEGDAEEDTSTSNVNAESIVANVLATAKKHNVDLQQVVEMLIDSATSTDNSVVESEVA